MGFAKLAGTSPPSPLSGPFSLTSQTPWAFALPSLSLTVWANADVSAPNNRASKRCGKNQ